MKKIDVLSRSDIEKYRQRSEMAINGLCIMIREAREIAKMGSDEEKWRYIAKSMGLKAADGEGDSLYNFFIPLGCDMVLLIRNMGDNDEWIYDKHEKVGRPDKRYVVKFNGGNVLSDEQSDWLDSEHHRISYPVGTLDNEEGVICYCQAYIDLLEDGGRD